MMLIADSGSTKTDWALVTPGAVTTVSTQGLNPYQWDAEGMVGVLTEELLPQLQTIPDYIDECEALLSESAKLNFKMWNPAQDASMNGGQIINGDERMSFHDAVARIKKNYNLHLQSVLDNL